MKDHHHPYYRLSEDWDPHKEARHLQKQSRPGHDLQWSHPLEEKVGTVQTREKVSGVTDVKETGTLKPARACSKTKSEEMDLTAV